MRLTPSLAALAAVALAAGTATAGPPYATDDPEPTDLHGWEIYAFVQGTRSRGSFDGSAGLDLNYGAAPGVQLTATLPVDILDEGRTRIGAGDLELGVKYRFFHDERAGLGIAVFPRLILPTAKRGFGTGRVAVLLPVWAQKDVGPWSLFGGAGYTVNPGAGNRDFWQEGLALTRTVSPRLSLGAEVTHEGRDAAGAGSTTRFGVGGIRKLKGPFSLLVSAGPSFEHHRDGVLLNGYVALAVNY
jgi:hypothetical protein